MSDPVLYRSDGDGIVILTLNRPEQRNPISDPKVIEALLAALERLESDGAARVAILTGAGKGFSSGGDIREMKPGGNVSGGTPVQTRANYKRGIQRLPLAFAALEVPVIAAVNGAAAGAGCDLACMCDLRIAAAGTKLGSTFAAIGLVPGDGGAFHLARVVGFARALELMLTARVVDADEALRLGLVHEVVPEDQLLARARQVAAGIAAHPPHAVQLTKRAAYHAWRADEAAALELAATFQGIAQNHPDHLRALGP